MALYLRDYLKNFAGSVFFYGNASHGLKDVLVWLSQHASKSDPNIVMPAYIPAKLYRTVLAAGCRPRFYEIYENCNFDLQEVKDLIDDQTLAIFVVHYFGLPSKIDELKQLAVESGAHLIEDCALTLCSRSNGHEIGTVGDCSIFSMSKMLLLPEGGFLVLNKKEWDYRPSHRKRVSSAFSAAGLIKTRAKRAYFLLTRGRDPLHLARWSQTGHIDLQQKQDLNVKNISLVSKRYAASIDLTRVIAKRRWNYHYLLENTKHLPYLQPLSPDFPEGFTPYSFPVRTSDLIRDSLRTKLLEFGIGCGVGWPESPFESRFTRTAKLSRELLELPIHQGITKTQLNRILECLQDFDKTAERALVTIRNNNE